MRRADVLIVTAIELEYRAALEVDEGAAVDSAWEEERGPNGLPVAYRTFRAEGDGAPLRVAVVSAADMGDVAAVNAVLPLVAALQPRCVAMCGVCAGRPGKVNLGDVVAADKLFFHDSGKRVGRKGDGGTRVTEIQQDISTFHLRPDWKRALERIDPRVEYADAEWLWRRPLPIEWQERWALARLRKGSADPTAEPDIDDSCRQWEQVIEGLWAERTLADESKVRLLEEGRLELTDAGRNYIDRFLLKHRGRIPDLSPFGETLPFRVHVASFASGDQVVEDEDVWSFITPSMRRTLGLDMEAAALGAVAHYQRDRGLDVLVMKGVMDFANHGRDDHFKKFAARASAECLIRFLRKNPPDGVRDDHDDALRDGGVPRAAFPSPSHLLDARHEEVPWHDAGPARLFAELETWADDAREVSAMLVHAEGGAGKTRLAMRWARQRRESGWRAGFLVRDPRDGWFERLCASGVPALIVIDYAESRADLWPILECVLRYRARKGPKRRVRVLLLARNAGDWWAAMLARDTEMRAWLSEVPAKELAPVAARGDERAVIFLGAARKFAGILGVPTVPDPPTALSDARFGHILYLHMAALAAVLGLPFEPATLLDVTLDHEERFWSPTAGANDDHDVALRLSEARQIVAAATLRGGLRDRGEARAVLARLLERSLDADDEKLLRQLHRVYERPNDGAYLPGLEPDLLGEGIVLRVARPPRREDEVGEGWIDRVLAGDEATPMRRALEVMGRTSVTDMRSMRPWIERVLAGGTLLARAPLALQAAKAVGQRTPFSALGDALEARLAGSADAALALALLEVGIPFPSVSLARVAAWITGTLVSTVHAIPGEDGDNVRLAELHGDHAAWTLFLGRHEEAFWSASTAVELCDDMAMAGTDCRAQLAAGLKNRGIALYSLRYFREAAVDLERAARLLRCALASNEVRPFDLMMALNALAGVYHALGRRQAAFETAREGLAISNQIPSEDQVTALLRGLDDLFERADREPRKEMAAEVLRMPTKLVEAVRPLAAAAPDELLPSLYDGLRAQASMARAAGRNDEAREALGEAVPLGRKLHALMPKSYAQPLAYDLNLLGAMRREAGSVGDALLSFEEGLNVLWPRADSPPPPSGGLHLTLLQNCRQCHDELERDLPLGIQKRLAAVGHHPSAQ